MNDIDIYFLFTVLYICIIIFYWSINKRLKTLEKGPK